MRKLPLSLAIPAALAAATAAPLAIPAAHAQDEDIIVTGRYGRLPADTQSVSQAVSYADLDLGTREGRDILRHRVSLTARYLCDKLGESDSSDGVVPSCRDAATRDALSRVGTVEEHWAPRGSAWVPHTAWTAPYPTDWSTRYP